MTMTIAWTSGLTGLDSALPRAAEKSQGGKQGNCARYGERFKTQSMTVRDLKLFVPG